jgi:pimeloyl-ACP methyl ester carboxylesterase
VHLRWYRFRPLQESPHPPLVLVPGLVSVMESFIHLVEELSRDFELIYLETAEKNSALVPQEYPFTIEHFSEDLNAFLSHLGFQREQYLLMGFSMGATVLLDACRLKEIAPAALILGEPSAEFSFPWWSHLLARVAAPVYPLIKPALLWYIRTFRVDTAADEEIYHIVSRALHAADPVKLCRTLRGIASYKAWPVLPLVRCPVLILGASKDTLHPYAETLLLRELISDCTLVDMENNLRNHSAEAAHVLMRFLGQLRERSLATA